MYSVKNVKSFLGRNGHGYNASLYRDGKKVAFIADMADGGPVRYEWESDADAQSFEVYAKSLPPVKAFNTMLPMSPDIYAGRLVDDFEFKKKLAAGMKKKTYFIHENKCFTSRHPYTPAMGAALAQRHPGAIFLNALTLDDAFKLYVKHAVDN